MGGAAAAWNPAGLAPSVGGHKEVWLVHLDGPTTTGIGGLIAAAALELPGLGPAGFAYRHVGVSDIPRTTTSPRSQPGSVSVGEDAATLSLARGFASMASAGVALRYARSAGTPEDASEASVDVGAHVSGDHALQPRVGVLVRGLGGRHTHVMAALAAATPPRALGSLRIDAAYGLDMQADREATEHRLSVEGTWDGRIRLGLGLNRGGADGWTALWMADVVLGRYSLGVLRENLVNDFGAANHYRLAIRLP